MNPRRLALIAALLLFPCWLSAAAQTYTAKTIVFQGATGYTDQDLLALTGLKTGVPMTADAINTAVQTLVDTGLFDDVTFQFKAGELSFAITPSTELKDVVLDNLPLKAGPELDARIRKRVPLYRGKVPTAGHMLDAVRQALEAELSAEGIDATVIALKTISDNPDLHFQQSIPQVRMGPVTLTGASTALEPGAQQVLAKVGSAQYSTLGSPNQLETELENYYRERAYLQVAVHATMVLPPQVSADDVRVPFAVTVTEGPQYHVGLVKLDPVLAITQQDFEHRTELRSGALAQASLLRGAWQTLTEDFHTRGYMRAKVVPSAAWDPGKGIVNFTVAAEPGAQYAMGKLTIDNANDDLRVAILSDWVMAEGAAFNPRRLLGGPDAQPTNAALQRYLAHEELKYTFQYHDDTHTIDVTLHLERRSL